MRRCAICKKPVASGLVVENECLDSLQEQLAAYKQAEADGRLIVRDGSCDSCQYKLQSESWKYNTYPCNECQRRTKDHYAQVLAE